MDPKNEGNINITPALILKLTDNKTDAKIG
jgi:hypothetical protein